MSSEDQRFYDHATTSVYLHPQAFALGQEDFSTFTMRVCIEWTEPSQAFLPPYSKKSSTRVPYPVNMRVHGIFYGQFARPGFCRRFKEVVVPTSETILKTIQMLVTQGDTTTYDSLHRVDLDLDRRVKELMTSTALQKMRLEMAEQIKREILEGPLVDEISQRVYQELKSAKESEGQDFKWGQQ